MKKIKQKNDKYFKLSALAIGLALASGATLAQTTPQDMGTVVVTAAGFEQNINDAPATISVISGDELRQKAYSDITDALRHVAGVQITGSGVEQNISIRGMAGDQTLYLVDGRPVSGTDAFGIPNRSGGMIQGNAINLLPPIEAIERIEVIRGPASALYGSDAIGGVINIITRKVNNEWSSSVTTQYTLADSDNITNNDSFLTSFVLNAPLIQDKLSLQLIGGFRSVDETDFIGNADPEYKQRNFGTKFGWHLDERNTVTFGNNFSQAERWRHPGVSLVDTGEVSYMRHVRNSYFVTHEGNYSGLIWNSYINLDESENRENAVNYEVLTLNTQATRFFDNHTVTGGVNYKQEDLYDPVNNELSGDLGLVDSYDRYQYAVFLEDEWSLTDDLAVTLSGRYDHNEDFGSNFAPKVYAVYHLTERFILRGGVTSGFKAPTLRQGAADYGSTSMGGAVLGNPDLEAETSLNKEIGITFSDPSLGLTTSFTVYHTDYDNKLTRSGSFCMGVDPCVFNGVSYPLASSGYTTTVNLDEVVFQGIEHTLDYRILDNLTYRHNYTFTESEFTGGNQTYNLGGTDISTGDFNGIPLNNNPKHMFNASLDWQTTDRLNLWTQINYRGKTSGVSASNMGAAVAQFDPTSKYPSYAFVDLGLGYRAKDDLNLNFGIYNVANKEVTPAEGYNQALDGRRFTFGMTQRF